MPRINQSAKINGVLVLIAQLAEKLVDFMEVEASPDCPIKADLQQIKLMAIGLLDQSADVPFAVDIEQPQQNNEVST